MTLRWTVFAVCALCAAARAQPRPEDKPEADRLFQEGRDLIANGNREEGCQKFDLSIRKDPRAVGTMLNLGLCREEAGRIATAVALYAEARDRAHDQGLHEHQEAAERKLALLAPRVPHVKLVLAAAPPNARVLVDDLVLAQDQLGDATVDPGHHVLVVTAPGRLPYEGGFDVAEGEHKTVAIPALATGTTIVVSERRNLWTKLAFAGGGGLVIAGLGLGWLAEHDYWDQFPKGASSDVVVARVPGKNCWTAGVSGAIVRQCNSAGTKSLDDARKLANVSTGVVITGGIAVAVGVVLLLTRPRDEAPPRVAIDAGTDHASVTFAGSF